VTSGSFALTITGTLAIPVGLKPLTLPVAHAPLPDILIRNR
jgi:hypothetical protein